MYECNFFRGVFILFGFKFKVVKIFYVRYYFFGNGSNELFVMFNIYLMYGIVFLLNIFFYWCRMIGLFSWWYIIFERRMKVLWEFSRINIF